MNPKRTYMNSAAAAIALEPKGSNVQIFPGRETSQSNNNEPQDKPSWIYRLFLFLGVTMANPENPRGWSFNPATATLTLTIAGLLLGGGYYMGHRDNENKHLLERIAATESVAAAAAKNAQDAKDLAMPIAIRGGHPPDTEDKKKQEKK